MRRSCPANETRITYHVLRITVSFSLFILAFLHFPFILPSPAIALASAGDHTYYIHTDHLGSVVAVTDEAGNSTQQLAYAPYGKEQSTDNKQQITERKYTGQIKDNNTTLSYYNARYYDPILSRFISADSVQGGNRFAYVAGNPISRSDPSGNKILEEEDEKKESKTTQRLKELTANPLPLLDNKFSSVFSDQKLIDLADQYISRNPFDPNTQREQFIKYLSKDIYNTIPWSPILSASINKENKYSSLYYNYLDSAPSPKNDLDEIKMDKKLSYYSNQYNLAKKQEDNEHSSYNSETVFEHLTQNQAVCSDLMYLTSLALSRVGIRSLIGGPYTFGHALSLVAGGKTGKEPYIVDSTWQGYYAPWSDTTKSTNTIYQYQFKDWEFWAPWGNPISKSFEMKKLGDNAN